MEKMFSPEFRNRLDAMITFNSLSQENIERVVDKFIIELDQQLNERKVFLQLTVRARRWFAERGYDPTFGARPMARLIQNEIKRVLADEILFGKLQNGGKVEVDESDRRAGVFLQHDQCSGGGRAAGELNRGLVLLDGTRDRCAFSDLLRARIRRRIYPQRIEPPPRARPPRRRRNPGSFSRQIPS